MITKATIENFTVFENEKFHFGKNLNVIIGENGTGKSHLMKALHGILFAIDEKNDYEDKASSKIKERYGLWSLQPLIRHKSDHFKFHVEFLHNKELFVTTLHQEKDETLYDPSRIEGVSSKGVFIPSQFSIQSEKRKETDFYMQLSNWGKQVKTSLPILDDSLEGIFYLDSLETRQNKNLPLSLLSQGQLRLGVLQLLLRNNAIRNCLFWEEPETSLNPKLISVIARCLLEISKKGVQVFFSTHSLFLLREIEMLLAEDNNLDARFFNLRKENDCVFVEQGSSLDDVGRIESLEEEIKQSERFLKG